MVKYTSDEIFEALGNPVRREMYERLARASRLSLSELAQPFQISLPAASKHVDILKESGLVVCKKEGRVKYCAANPEALANAMSWFTSMEQVWEERFDRLDAYLKKSKTTK